MTALSKYQRLETFGLWRSTADAQRREVLVSFRDATLILSDSRSELALGHWSLPAIVRLNPGQMPAIFAPGVDGDETLELEDSDMVAALETVQRAVAAKRPRPGRGRLGLLAAMFVAVAALAVFWFPVVLVGHTAEVLPVSKRVQIGRVILGQITPRTGVACAQPAGVAALTRLVDNLLGPNAGVQVLIMPDVPKASLSLPGGFLVLNRGLLDLEDSPELVAAHILAELLRGQAHDPMLDVLDWAGLRATLALLTTGDLPTVALQGYADRLLVASPARVLPAALLAAFADKGVPASPYARHLPLTEAAPLLAGDPLAQTPPPAALASDADWVRLQGICGG